MGSICRSVFQSHSIQQRSNHRHSQWYQLYGAAQLADRNYCHFLWDNLLSGGLFNLQICPNTGIVLMNNASGGTTRFISTGNITIDAPAVTLGASGHVLNIPGGTTLNLPATGVGAGSCTLCALTYQADGRLTAASSNTATAIQLGSTVLGTMANYIKNSATMAGSGWNTRGGTATAGQSDPFGGTNAVKITQTSSQNYVNSGTILTSGSIYTACGWVRGDVGGERINVDIGGTSAGTTGFLTTAWTLIMGFSNAPTTSLTSTITFTAAIPSQTVYLYGWTVAPPGTSCVSPGIPTGATPVVTPISLVNTQLLTTNAVQPGVIYSAAGTALPSCTSAITGQMSVVSDATAPTIWPTMSAPGQ
jgi:hypothetical protein